MIPRMSTDCHSSSVLRRHEVGGTLSGLSGDEERGSGVVASKDVDELLGKRRIRPVVKRESDTSF